MKNLKVNKKGIQHAGRNGFNLDDNFPTWSRIAKAAIEKGYINESELYKPIGLIKQTWLNWKKRDFMNVGIKPIILIHLLQLLDKKFEEIFIEE
ncbi:MAG: hypothetical protein AB8B69_00995 [Chitinophagales bacterium]